MTSYILPTLCKSLCMRFSFKYLALLCLLFLTAGPQSLHVSSCYCLNSNFLRTKDIYSFFWWGGAYFFFFKQIHQRIMQCCQHWKQSWTTTQALQLALWWQNLSSRLYCLLWPLHYLQNKETHHLFSRMTIDVELPPLDVPSFWALLCLSGLRPSACHPHREQGVYSVVQWAPSPRW